MKITLELSERYVDALDRRIEQRVSELEESVANGGDWSRQAEKVTVDEVPDKADYISLLVREDLESGSLEPEPRDSDDE